MDCDRLFVMVEGVDDKLFFEEIIEPRIAHKVSNVDYLRYSQKSPTHIDNKIDNKVKAFQEMPMDVEYIFLADREEGCESAEEKRDELERKYENLDRDKISVAVVDIESWYFGGLDQEACDNFSIPYFNATDNKGKRDIMQELDSTLYTSSNVVRSFLKRITGVFDVSECKNSNDSFKKFCQTIGVK